MVPMQYSGFAKKSKEKKLKREIQALKRQLKQERKISGKEAATYLHTYMYCTSIRFSLNGRLIEWALLTRGAENVQLVQRSTCTCA